MNKPRPVSLVIHGHFYQPPRENPWTDEMPREPGASPFHDWNERIHAESYRANAYARIFHGVDKVKALVNNYERLTFNFGPTLARWIERHDPRTIQRIREGDAAQVARLGKGGGLAQVWGHPIAPLLSPRDLRTQILWGLHDFRQRFGRDAEGIWLPETAANAATLEALIDAGVRFTILAPEQVEAVRRPGKDWVPVTADTIETHRLYRWPHPDGSGRSLALAIFDGPVSRDLAFGNATRDADKFLEAVRKAAERAGTEPRRLVVAASDGELYGHHKKFADLTLAYTTQVAAAPAGVEITNLAAFLERHPPTWEARLRTGPDGEGTAWSCSHGVGRWRRHCGCAMDASRGWRQDWRGPMRDALDLLRDRAAVFFADAAGDIFQNAWQARDEYGAVVDAPPEQRLQHLKPLGLKGLKHDQTEIAERALGLMEMQRSLLLMYASCGWFFDDIAGLESTIDLRRAGHAVDLWRNLGGRPPENDFLDILAQAQSNQPELGTGADAYRRACHARVTPARALATVAFTSLAQARTSCMGTQPVAVPGFTLDLDLQPRKDGDTALSGRATVVHRRTGKVSQLAFSASHNGHADFECRVGDERVTLDDLAEENTQDLRLAMLAQLAEQATSVEICRSMLEIADHLGVLSDAQTSEVNGRFASALIKLLHALNPGTTGAVEWDMVALLVQRAGLRHNGEHAYRTQEAVWVHLSFFQSHRRRPPKPLRALAERLGFEISSS
jgi:alpha-amylase/alpha-mannosidase (GH57 family)